MRPTLLLLALLTATTTQAQWDIQQSNTTASLRGIHALGNGVAWASGTAGTVLHTTDDGAHWLPCTTPPGAEALDFRGIQAFDQNTAIVMSSGKGDLSRLYKTTDACKSWKLLFTNPDPEGFWDALKMQWRAGLRFDDKLVINGLLIGDPVDRKFVEFQSNDGEHWTRYDVQTSAVARNGESLFAASNSSLYSSDGGSLFVTGGVSGSRSLVQSEYVKSENSKFYPHVSWNYVGGDIPIQRGESAGAFSLATSHVDGQTPAPSIPEPDRVFYADTKAIYVVVGGDYKKQDKASGTAAFSIDVGQHWHAAKTPPHGYRSAVAYSPTHKLWITVGPNGTDISTDDGRNWRALKPLPTQPADADQNWNALSLPFVVGPKGRIGKLNPAALPNPSN